MVCALSTNISEVTNEATQQLPSDKASHRYALAYEKCLECKKLQETDALDEEGLFEYYVDLAIESNTPADTLQHLLYVEENVTMWIIRSIMHY